MSIFFSSTISAQHAGGIQAGKPGQVHGRLGVAGALQHAAFAGLQRRM